ncbi:MAG: AAA family ATPase [Candidatus Omnitrophota bacterium]|nr:AAA family ATPase [Candidatus Omnitrophota bacterium]
MKIISVANQKGGCGKTTLAVNVAAALARLGSETLLIDLDPQAHATFALGYASVSSERKTSYDIFRAHFDNTDVPFDQILISDRERYSFIPANMMLSAAEINLGGVNGAAALVFRTLSDHFFEKYEYVIIDSPPSFGFLTLNSMYAADSILVPLDLSYFSFNGIDSVYRVTSLLETETGRKPSVFFVMNIYDKRSNFAKQFEKDARQRLGPYLIPAKIRSSVRLREAARQGKTIFEYDPKCSAALDFYNLTSEILTSEDRGVDMIVKEFSFHAPEAGAVYVLGDFNEWKKTESNRLLKLENGDWSTHCNLKRGTYRYKFLVDDKWISDPENPETGMNVFGTTDSVLKIM